MATERTRSVLVTGVGGGVGQSVLKALRGSRYRVVAADAEPLATGLFAADRSFLVPYAADPKFVERLLEICAREDCALIVPGLDAELPVLARARERFAAAGVLCAVSSPAVIDVCDDKLLTCRFLACAGLPAPRTLTVSDGDLAAGIGFPMVLKPRMGGHRSLGVYVARDALDLERRIAGVDRSNYVAQEWIDGSEYTCGTVSFDGRCRGTIVMRRTLRDGDTYKAFVEHHPEIERTVRAAVEALAPLGACNFQLRVRDGVSYIFDINARSSGTTHCRALAGFNEPVAVAEYLLEGIEPTFSIREIAVLRYWNELVVDGRRVEQLAAAGFIDGNGSFL
jgi:carbamoyl-phosphate synthase large subunit